MTRTLLKAFVFLLITILLIFAIKSLYLHTESKRMLALLSYNNQLVLLPWDGKNIIAKPLIIENPLNSAWQCSEILMPGNNQAIILDNKRKALFSLLLNDTTSSPSPIASNVALSSPTHMAYDPTGHRIFITNKDDDAINILTLTDRGFAHNVTIKGDLSGLRKPDLLAYDQKTGELAVYNSDNKILYFDTKNANITEPIRILYGFKTRITNPTYLAINSNRQLLLVAGNESVIAFSTKAENNVPPLFELAFKNETAGYAPEFYYDDEMSTLYKMSTIFSAPGCNSGSTRAAECYVKTRIEEYAVNNNELLFVKSKSFDSDTRENCANDKLFCSFSMDTKNNRAVFAAKNKLILTDGLTKQYIPLNKDTSIFNLPESLIYNNKLKDIMIGNIADATFSYLSLNSNVQQPVFNKKVYYKGYLAANVFDKKHDLVITAGAYGMTVAPYEQIKNNGYQLKSQNNLNNVVPFDTTEGNEPLRPHAFEFSEAEDFLIMQAGFRGDILLIYDHNGSSKEWVLKNKILLPEFKEIGENAGPSGIAFDDNAMELYVSLRNKNAVAVFSIDKRRQLKLVRMIKGPETKIDRPSVMAVDPYGKKLIVSDSRQHINIYELGAGGNIAPLSIIKGDDYDLSSISAIRVIGERSFIRTLIHSKLTNMYSWLDYRLYIIRHNLYLD